MIMTNNDVCRRINIKSMTNLSNLLPRELLEETDDGEIDSASRETTIYNSMFGWLNMTLKWLVDTWHSQDTKTHVKFYVGWW